MKENVELLNIAGRKLYCFWKSGAIMEFLEKYSCMHRNTWSFSVSTKLALKLSLQQNVGEHPNAQLCLFFFIMFTLLWVLLKYSNGKALWFFERKCRYIEKIQTSWSFKNTNTFTFYWNSFIYKLVIKSLKFK